MADQNIINYREALRSLWDLEAAPPEPGDTEWMEHWTTQSSVIEDTQFRIASKIGWIGILRIIADEYLAWKAEQEPKAEG